MNHLANLGRVALWLLCLLAWCCARAPQPPVGQTDSASAIESPALPPIEAPSEPSAGSTAIASAPTTTSTDPIIRIRDEGLNRSQVMKTLSYLTDVIGPRLTGSPALRRANNWTQQTLASWGLENARQEAWGPFGRGWTLKRFSAQVIEPQDIPLIAYPKAWSPGFEKPLVAEVVWLDAKTEADFEKYRGKIKGAIVLSGAPREVAARFDPLATRVSDSDLLKLANADVGNSSPPGMARVSARAGQSQSSQELLLTPATSPSSPAAADGRRGRNFQGARATSGPTTRPSTAPAALAPPNSPRAIAFQRRLMEFMNKEGVALIVTPSTQGDGGTLFVSSASGPNPQFGRTPVTSEPATQPSTKPVWAVDGPKILPQMMLSIEHYNRLVRMIQLGERPKMQVDLQVQFNGDDLMAYNTVAEIPGTDLKDQIVMIGAHMDSWHSGTGATDNGAGCASVMEAVRIIKAAGLQPRRTIRIALWTGEEQGIFGSKAYVEKHFGKFDQPATRRSTNLAFSPSPGTPGEGRGEGFSSSDGPASTSAPSSILHPPSSSSTKPTSRPARKFLPGPEWSKLSVYFNLDNGTGKIRGVYLQGNEAVRPLFRKWLTPFADLGAETITLNNTGGTDHLSFDAVGLPGFQFIQDPIDYFSRTHHSNQDLYDRAQAEDLKQAATIMAAFLYNAAMLDEKLPRKPLRAGEN